MAQSERGNSISQNENGKCGGNNMCPSEQQWKVTGLCFLIYKAFSALISEMNEVTIFLLLFAQCFPVTSSQGGNRPVRLFFCTTPGCASNVTNIFCNDKLLFEGTRITDCTGLPPPNTVCQYDGHAFICIDGEGSCEFEGNDGHIDADKCTDHSNICAFINATASSPVTADDHTGYIVGVCGVLLLLLLIGLYLWFSNNRRNEAPSDVTQSVARPSSTSLSSSHRIQVAEDVHLDPPRCPLLQPSGPGSRSLEPLTSPVSALDVITTTSV